jgi:hypothetical protein
MAKSRWPPEKSAVEANRLVVTVRADELGATRREFDLELILVAIGQWLDFWQTARLPF